MFEVGDAVQLTFTTTAGAGVNVSWIDPTGIVVLDKLPVAESPTVPGDFPYTLQFAAPGVWEARFTASGTATQVERYYMRAVALTGPPPLAAPNEIVPLFRALTAAEESTAASLLRRASAMVRGRFPDVDDQIAAGTLDGEQVGLAVIEMVLRVMRNPEALRSETRGPFSRSYDPVAASSRLTLTEAEIAVLTAVAATEPAGTITLTAGLAPQDIAYHPTLGRRDGYSWKP